METIAQHFKLDAVLRAIEIFAFIYCVLILFAYHRRSTSTNRQLTDTISERSWNGEQAAIFAVGFFISMNFIPLAFRAMGYSGKQGVLLASAILGAVVQIIIVRHISQQRGKTWGEDFGMNRRNLERTALALIICIVTFPIIAKASFFYQELLNNYFSISLNNQDIVLQIIHSKTWIKTGLILTTITLIPLCEELLFRGVLFPYLTRKIGLAASTLAVSAAFAFVHLNLASALAIFLLSVVLCLAYWRTGTLWVSIAIHALFNSTSLLLLFIDQ
ncbi:MAG: CPBP family intramembrane metalloprotease [Pontiellaceae bacterium]|nr:CPBP family intramembrane metalloprotease [Pontiellaceae bacterium]